MIALALSLALVQAPRQAAPTDSVVDRLAVEVATGVAPETVTVGDRFRSFVAVRHAPGVRVIFAGLPPTDSLQLVDSPRVARSDSVRLAVVFPLAAWAATDSLRRSIAFEVSAPGAKSRRYRVALRLPVVHSVLPAEGDVEPRPPKGLLAAPGETRGWWWLALVALAVAMVVALAARWWARRGAAPAFVDPREEALAALANLRPDSVDTGSVAAFYASATRALRRYLARTRPEEWGEELTTRELLQRTHAADARVESEALNALLAQADPVKFGGERPGTERARRFLEELRCWIEANPRPAPPEREAA